MKRKISRACAVLLSAAMLLPALPAAAEEKEQNGVYSSLYKDGEESLVVEQLDQDSQMPLAAGVYTVDYQKDEEGNGTCTLSDILQTLTVAEDSVVYVYVPENDTLQIGSDVTINLPQTSSLVFVTDGTLEMNAQVDSGTMQPGTIYYSDAQQAETLHGETLQASEYPYSWITGGSQDQKYFLFSDEDITLPAYAGSQKEFSGWKIGSLQNLPEVFDQTSLLEEGGTYAAGQSISTRGLYGEIVLEPVFDTGSVLSLDTDGLKNAGASLSDEKASEDSVIELKVTPETGYEMKTAPEVSLSDPAAQASAFEEKDGSWICSITGITEDTTVKVTGSAVKPETGTALQIRVSATEGGTFTMSPESGITAGMLVALDASADEGYVFAGWKSGDEILSKDPSWSFTAEKDMEIEAVFEKSAVRTITFNANGGTMNVTTLTTTQDGTLENLPVPERSGYTFEGWYTQKEDGEKVSTSTVFDKDTTLYARWTKTTDVTNTSTNSNSLLWFGIAIVAAAVAGILTFLLKRKNRQDDQK